MKKIYTIVGITRENDGIIFLSDIRLNSNKQVAATLDITKRLHFRGYNFFHNARENSRVWVYLFRVNWVSQYMTNFVTLMVTF
jgi:hypothetical protein